jgi:predicted nuclease with TOPRIM domain
MAETTDTQVQATTPPVQENPEAPKIDEIQARIDAAIAPFKAELEKKQTEVRGLDKKIGELNKTLQAKDIEKMSDLEKAKFEIEQAKAEADEIRQTATALKKQNLVVSQGLPAEFANLISGTTDEEITKSINTVKTQIESEIVKRVEAATNKFYGGKPPITGQPPAGKTMSRAEFNNITDAAEKAKIAKEYKIID